MSRVLRVDVVEGSSAPVIGFALRGLSGPTCTSHQGTCYRDGDDLSSLDISYMEHPKNMDKSQNSGSKEGEDQGSKEVVEEKKGVRVVEDQRVVKEVEGDSQLEV